MIQFTAMYCLCEIDASGSVSFPRRLSVDDTVDYAQHFAGHLAEMHVCGRTHLAYVIMLIGTHVVGGNGYPRCYESVFFSSSCFCITEWRESTMMAAYKGFMHTVHVRGTRIYALVTFSFRHVGLRSIVPPPLHANMEYLQ